MANELIRVLASTTLAMTLALPLVLTIRTPLRRLFGARVAYLAWWLVPLAMLAVLLPAPVREMATLTRGAMVAIGMAPMQTVVPDSTALALPDYRLWLLSLWSGGLVFAALLFHRMQGRYLRALGDVSPVGDGVFVSQAAGICPAVVGAWKPRIVLPADFETRYPAREGEMVLAHERAHLRRGDTAVNLAVVALRCAYWFNPLLHWAASRFRQDQELACDALVLGQFPDRRRSYAEAMLKTQLAVLGLPVGCHWQSSQSLKERIVMLKRPLPGRPRRRAGVLLVAIVACACSYAAWALQPGQLVKVPAMIGSVVEDAVAVANVVTIGDTQKVEVTGAGMATGENGSTNVFLTPHVPLTASVGQGSERWELRAFAMQTSGAPTIAWTLSHAGSVVQESKAGLQDGQPLLLQVGEDGSAATRLRISISAAPVDKVMRTAGADDPAVTEQPRLDGDGAYRYAHAGAMYSPMFTVSGEAVLLLSIDAAGEIQEVEVEEVKPAGALDKATAKKMVGDNRFSPKFVNGRAVASLVRMPMVFGPAPPSRPAGDNAARTGLTRAAGTEPTLTYSGNVATRVAPRAGDMMADRPVAIKDAPPPAYPAEALSRKLDGKVVLIVDVGADGSVTKARVDTSNPATVFDAAALEAVRKWKFTPATEQGKTVPGKVRVPITFVADAEADGTIAGAESGKQHLWYRNAAEPPVREAFCDAVRVRQNDETGDISDMECGIAAARDDK